MVTLQIGKRFTMPLMLFFFSFLMGCRLLDIKKTKHKNICVLAKHKISEFILSAMI